ncbi:mevalonate kinase [Pseudomonas sp. BW7P1]|uniref:mevalonate kinase family protein n=1 Tax=Pseudomonas TaxID=286 RepID=UPI0021AE0414|nr:hypothetical protein [Pseudomonas sp. BW7P1]UWI60908.1 hypothetical protein NWV16_22880 [Pseudomonas sp. BW7P1]
MIHARAPGKIILMGEHAALHGCPVIACSVGLYCNVWIRPRQDGEIELQLPDLLLQQTYSARQLIDYTARMRMALKRYQATPGTQTFAALANAGHDHLVKCAIGEFLLRIPPQHWRGFTLRVQSQIPPGAGFGSSGALAVSLSAALMQGFGLTENDCPLEPLALSIERFQHGEPSGIDHNTSLLGSVVEGRRNAKGELDVYALPVITSELLPVTLRLFNTGTALESTGQVIAATRHRLEGPDSPLLASMRRNTERFSTLMRQTRPMPETFRAVIRDYEADLEALGVVPEAVAQVIRAVEQAGGAAKICGAGALSGDQAGVLLVLGATNLLELARYRQLDAPLAVAGLEITRS